MKASNGRDATPSQYLEHLRQKNGIEHARRIRDELGWRWRASAIRWTIRHHWLSWCLFITAVIAVAADLKSLFG